ncbi:MAG: DUF4203 domain-containing protein [Lachnospiraceae bacterium]|nr:DUF4203 domain-containing protein [Lachnospiraceae bacterium]
MTNVFETLDLLLKRYGIGQIPQIATEGAPAWLGPAVIWIAVIIGFIYCFLGYKSMRMMTTLLGIVIGLSLGTVLAGQLKLNRPIDIAVMAGGAVLFGVLGFFLYRVFMFLSVFIASFCIAMSLIAEYMKLDQLVIFIVALVVGVIFAILAAVYLRPMIIVSTALSGGLIIANELFENLIHIRWSSSLETIIRLSTGLILAVIGMIYQFRTTPKEEEEEDEE